MRAAKLDSRIGGPSRLYRRSQVWKLERLWLKWRQVRLALQPCSSYHRMTLSLWRALVDRPASARVSATAMGSSLDTAVAPGRIAPYTCMGTPYLPRLMTHYGVRYVSGRAQGRGLWALHQSVWTRMRILSRNVLSFR